MRHAQAIFVGVFAYVMTATAAAGPITGSMTMTPATEADSFQIMTPAEIAEQRAKMSELEGEAREAYREKQYQVLRERARGQGYEMPETPPWDRPNVPPSGPPATAAASASASPSPANLAARRAELQREVEARREELRKQVESRHAAMGISVPPSAEKRRAAQEAAAAERREAAEKAATEHREAVEQAAAERRKTAEKAAAERRQAYAGEPPTGPMADEAQDWQDEAARVAEERRKAIQARIDQAIEGLGERPPAPPSFYPAPSTRYGVPPGAGYGYQGYYPPQQPYPSTWNGWPPSY